MRKEVKKEKPKVDLECGPTQPSLLNLFSYIIRGDFGTQNQVKLPLKTSIPFPTFKKFPTYGERVVS